MINNYKVQKNVNDDFCPFSGDRIPVAIDQSSSIKTSTSSPICSIAVQRDHTSPLNLILPSNSFTGYTSSSLSPSKTPPKGVSGWTDTKDLSPQLVTPSTWSRPYFGSPENSINNSTTYHSPTNMPPPLSPVRVGWPQSPHKSPVHRPSADVWAGSLHPNPQTSSLSIANSCPQQYHIGPPLSSPRMPPPSPPTVHWTNIPPPLPPSTTPPVGMSSPPAYNPQSSVHNIYSPLSPTSSHSQSLSRSGLSSASSSSCMGPPPVSPSTAGDLPHHGPKSPVSKHWQPWESPKTSKYGK